MAQYRFQAVCQWCGATGSTYNRSIDVPPTSQPVVSGKCKSHPSGRKDMPHGPRWEKR